MSPERQWHEIWKVLFKNTLPREGPYMGNTKEEIAGATIAICKKGSSRVVPGIIRSLGLPTEKGKAVQKLVEELFSGFEALSEPKPENPETQDSPSHDGAAASPVTPRGSEQESAMPIRLSPMAKSQDPCPTAENNPLENNHGQCSDISPRSSEYTSLRENSKGDDDREPHLHTKPSSTHHAIKPAAHNEELDAATVVRQSDTICTTPDIPSSLSELGIVHSPLASHFPYCYLQMCDTGGDVSLCSRDLFLTL
ncbi:hypothetical protein FBEOM_13732 [Fusarium beomiforme]|uniref:Uncharacterized protein n=1 Tax=Fusarium beomiforme TaxID=44412 RepID=A0A9P5A6N6_9HYPO|nr:hypothetical protein FBEOM_13732 [Fusarium beomiforme]